MRTRRRFQPILDSMPSRIAPSSLGLPAPTVSVAIQSPLTGTRPAGTVLVQTDDNTSYPIITVPVSPNPPPTLLC